MIRINIDKLYRFEHPSEPCFIGFPLPAGTLTDIRNVSLYAEGIRLPVQAKASSLYKDGSVRFLFLRFLADIPAHKGMTVECVLDEPRDAKELSYAPVSVTRTESGFTVSTREADGTPVSFAVKHSSTAVLDAVNAAGMNYSADCFEGPVLKEKGQAGSYDLKLGTWEIAEEGPVAVVFKTTGLHTAKDTNKTLKAEVRLTAWAGKPYTEISYRLINTDPSALDIQSLRFGLHLNEDNTAARSCVASSNYRTSYTVREDGSLVSKTIDADWIMKEANEHFHEVFHGTFFGDCTKETGGVCATVYQAHQNFPKAIEADREGIRIFLAPEGAGEVIMQSGMAREQKFLLHFHRAEEPLESLNDRSIVYQMPVRPYVSPEVHKASGVWPDIFDRSDRMVDRNLVGRADGHCRAYGMLNFGDSYDSNYTAQGRGNGRLVWCNNEYDYPHACALMFVRTGITRFLDYVIASCTHWMDVDVCHWHEDPLYVGGQWEHTAGHVINGVMVCSHQWVEGLLDYYHFTGDERGLETAIGIGQNIQRLLDTPAYAKTGEYNARETGWALRTLTALYAETGDESWVEKCSRIVNDFRVWEETYGHWMAPYTDNTLIRVPFMISVAIGSLMRYYRVFPGEELKNMILRQADDLIENCYVKEWGIFYYKELPSLCRLGNNTLLLEAMAAAYELSGDRTYLEYGLETFRNAMSDTPHYNSAKRKIEDAVIVGSESSKTFAQSMIPLSSYWTALSESGLTYR